LIKGDGNVVDQVRLFISLPIMFIFGSVSSESRLKREWRLVTSRNCNVFRKDKKLSYRWQTARRV